MTVTNKVLVQAKYVSIAQTTQYTASDVKAIIDKFTVTNIHATDNVFFSCNIAESGDTASSENLILQTYQLAPGQTYTCPELVNHDLNFGDFISTLASAADSLVMRVSGREISA